MDDTETDQAWWIQCYFRGTSGRLWTGKLLLQGATKEEGEFIVISARDDASAQLAAQGNFFWVVPDDDLEDRLVPASRLAYVELLEVR